MRKSALTLLLALCLLCPGLAAAADGGDAQSMPVYIDGLLSARAYVSGRDYVLPEDIRDVARPVLGHRIFSGGGARAQEAELLLDRMIGEIPVPLEKK